MTNTRKPKPKTKTVGLPRNTYDKLDRVCAARGWQKYVAVDRLADRELAMIERENAEQGSLAQHST